MIQSIFGENFLRPSAEILADTTTIAILGLAGVFTVLILFFIVTKLLILFSTRTSAKKQEQNQ